ncbi:hypothetical protein ABHN05_13155 [Brevibacillus laterosporus]|uniref:Uncharacterized protein n=1 Tax=Brevibacillus laterosporus TaxID=1465 RepID=A0A518V206_BRELA|nr:hypothetical protein [Brevibacillus laterosporus]MBG9790977.1 hypothetical protein [Brevibacillus laterosporus]MBG9804900.1 hypothetical protein [Brevibacillus laterosporus]MED1790547.1 hypothetical protein [Brevibacillus laterosporus]MED4762092.1 hypothetical protein [Brevibacillus laterosporus]QDX91018.1 hypothetical protein EEL30_00675 [Brevibacillus laterosporus]
MNKKLTKKWNETKAFFTNNRGTVLLEKKVLLVVIVVGILGLSSLGYLFLKEYWKTTSDSIKNNTQINETVEW